MEYELLPSLNIPLETHKQELIRVTVSQIYIFFFIPVDLMTNSTPFYPVH